MKHPIRWILLTSLALINSMPAQANTIINNYGSPNGYSTSPMPPQQAPQQPACNPYPTQQGIPPGHYSINHGDGTSEQIYTTGTKNPYYVDNPCAPQQQPIIQPYVNVPPPVYGNNGNGNGQQQPMRPMNRN